MLVPCPKCKADVWFETHWDCPKCGAAMRRCVDCRHYDAERSFCGALDGQVSADQAREPSRLSISYHCTSYERVPGAIS